MTLRVSHQSQQPGGSHGPPESDADLFGGRSFDMAHVSLLDQDDMRRIRNNVANIDADQQRKREQQEDLKRLHDLSKERVSKWENTIRGQQLAKLRARDVRAAKEEEVKLKLDAEEAERQSKERQDAIERARTMKYYQTDNVKAFHGAMLLSHVLNERDKQVEIKKKRMELKQQIGADWREEKNLRHEKEEMKEILKLKAVRQRNMCTFAEQKIQTAKKTKMQATKDEAKRKEEAEVVKGDAKYRAAQKTLDAEARQLARDNYLELVEATSKSKVLKAEEDEQDLLLDESIRVYASAKENMIRLSKKKKQQSFENKEMLKEKLSSYVAELNEDYASKRPPPHHSTKAGVFDRILEDRTDLVRKEAINKDAIASHEGMIQSKNQLKEKERMENIRILEEQIADYTLYESQRKAAKTEKLQRGIQLQGMHKQQMQEREIANQKESLERLKVEAEVNQAVIDEEKHFEDYAKGVIRDLEETPGQSKQNIQPMYNNLNEKHKKPGRRAPKDHGKPSITKQRLGLDSRSKPVLMHVPKKRGTYAPRPVRQPQY